VGGGGRFHECRDGNPCKRSNDGDEKDRPGIRGAAREPSPERRPRKPTIVCVCV
jgi:hypothetical protein